jgi:hypothetical protein
MNEVFTEYLEHRKELSEDLKHYLVMGVLGKVEIITKEIDKLDIIINNLITKLK